MSKDWTGNQNSIFKTLGSSHHSTGEREENDFYATEPRAAEWLLKIENFNNNIWEPACGMGHLSKVFIDHGYNVKSSDLIDRGYGETGINFLGKQSGGGLLMEISSPTRHTNLQVNLLLGHCRLFQMEIK